MTLPRSFFWPRLAVCLTIVVASASPSSAQTLPAAPGQLESHVVGIQVRLSWNTAGDQVTAYRIEVGSTPSGSNLVVRTVPGTQLGFNTSAPGGTYFVRVRAVNDAGIGPASNEVTVVVGACPSPPPAPGGITASAAGTSASVAWPDTPLASSFILEAGTAPLLSDVFVGDVGSTRGITAGVAPGTYFVRVRATNACGTSGPSPEGRLVVGATAEPSDLIAAVAGSQVTVAWGAPDGGAPGGYVIEVGSAPGASNLATIANAGPATALTASGVAPGTYYVRVRAVRATGPGRPSNEVAVVVGGGVPSVSIVGFGGITATEPLVGYEEAGVAVTPAGGAWQQRIVYGNPSPYVGFTRVGSSDSTAALSVAAAGTAFRFTLLDAYSSVTSIPLVVTGMLGPHVVYSVATTVPQTFGRFATVLNPHRDAVVDRVLLTLSNDFAGNPMGVDNLAVVRD